MRKLAAMTLMILAALAGWPRPGGANGQAPPLRSPQLSFFA